MLEGMIGLFLLSGLGNAKYQAVVQEMQNIAKKNPTQVEMVLIGTNNQGQEIKGLKIGNGPTNSLVVATHHGNEYGSTAVALGFAEALAVHPIKGQTVYVVPVLNISGFDRKNRYESNLSSMIDSNRDYPGPCVKGKTFKLKSTQSLAQFLVDKNIVISATLHTYFPAVVYPWGISTEDLETPYEKEYKNLVELATQDSGYQTGNNTAVLYPADGTFEDYAYWKHGIWSLLFELGDSHSPDEVSIGNMVTYNTPGLRRFLENAPTQRVSQHQFTGRCDNRRLQRVFLE